MPPDLPPSLPWFIPQTLACLAAVCVFGLAVERVVCWCERALARRSRKAPAPVCGLCANPRPLTARRIVAWRYHPLTLRYPELQAFPFTPYAICADCASLVTADTEHPV